MERKPNFRGRGSGLTLRGRPARPGSVGRWARSGLGDLQARFARGGRRALSTRWAGERRRAWPGLGDVPALLTRGGRRGRRSPGGPRLRLTVAGAAAVTTGVVVTVVARTVSAARSGRQSVIPASVIPHLTETVSKIAVTYGDPAPAEIAVVATTRDRALTVATPGDTAPDPTPVYLVVMRGQFTGLTSQPGVPVPTGSYLSLVLNPATLAVEEMGISHEQPTASLDSLGTVVHLQPAQP